MHLNKKPHAFTHFFYSWLWPRATSIQPSSTPRPAATILRVAKSGTKPCPFQEGGNFCNMRSFGHIRAEAAVPAPHQTLAVACGRYGTFPRQALRSMDATANVCHLFAKIYKIYIRILGLIHLHNFYMWFPAAEGCTGNEPLPPASHDTCLLLGPSTIAGIGLRA